MAISKKYSRRVVVDGVAYRWRIPPDIEYDQTDHDGRILVIVWREDDPGRMLRLIAGLHPGGRHFRRVGTHDTITPGRVADGIRLGLRAGWQPAKRGRGLTLDLPVQPPITAGHDDA